MSHIQTSTAVAPGPRRFVQPVVESFVQPVDTRALHLQAIEEIKQIRGVWDLYLRGLARTDRTKDVLGEAQYENDLQLLGGVLDQDFPSVGHSTDKQVEAVLHAILDQLKEIRRQLIGLTNPHRPVGTYFKRERKFRDSMKELSRSTQILMMFTEQRRNKAIWDSIPYTKQIADAPINKDSQAKAEPRPRTVFFAARALDQSEFRSESREETGTSTAQRMTAESYSMTEENAALTSAFGHWGVFVSYEDDLESGALFELMRHGTASVARQDSGSILKETVNGRPRWSIVAHAHTTLPNDAIHQLAKGVITKLGEDYDVTSGNCQSFSNKLLLCIRKAESQRQVFDGLSDLPYEFAAPILKRRCKEWKEYKAIRGLSVLWYAPIDLRPITVEIVLHIVIPLVFTVLSIPLGKDIISRDVTWLSLVCTAVMVLLSPWLNSGLAFYKAELGAIRNWVLGKPRTEVVLAELIDRIDETAVEDIDVQSVIAEVPARTFL